MPTNNKIGNLPHLSSIDEKPENLGTELKVAMVTETHITLFFEIQMGKSVIDFVEYVDEIPWKTSACTARLVKGATQPIKETIPEELINNQNARDTYLGDAWFGSVLAVVALKKKFNTNFVGVVKGSHGCYPKNYLPEVMKEWPAGSHLVLESKIEGVDIIAMGYKYNHRKVINFIFTKGAAHTEPGKPYEGKWKDKNGNT